APKLAEYGLADRVAELNAAAVRIAKREGSAHVLADMGPTGLVMEPLGPATFEEIFSAFAEQAAALASAGPDALLIETMTDISEARCAVLAAKSVCDLPVFVTCTFGLNGRMDLSGTEPETAAIVIEAAGADAVGMNCGLGPEQMLPLLERMISTTRLPVIVQPNAGLPQLDEEGHTVFPGTPEEMGAFAAAAREAGAAMVGSCCGSTPVYTGAIVDAVADKDVAKVADRGFPGLVVAGPRGWVGIGRDWPVRVIGERINPTGKKALSEELKAGSMSIVRSFAVSQEAAGADLLDVNVGAAGVDAKSTLPVAVLAAVASSSLPLVLDTTDFEALEAALRVYPGKALVNSVNGEAESISAVLPLVAKYGAAVVVLALDETGIPATAEGRVAIVEKVRAAARDAGVRDEDLIVDTLVMTAATDGDAPRVTVGALAAVHESGLATMLGVSNVSHGLPSRALLNAAFFEAATDAGLDAGIVNPNDNVMMEAVRTANAARAVQGDGAESAEGAPGEGEGAASAPGQGASGAQVAPGGAWAAWDAAYATALSTASGADALSGAEAEEAAAEEPAVALALAVLRGDSQGAPGLVDAVVASGTPADAIIGDILTPTIQRLGDAFGRGEAFLPQMMIAADAMKSAVTRVKTYLPEGSADGGAPRVVFATVKGDIHSIGKDICVSLLESQGFEVDDLGADVAIERVVEAAGDTHVVCLSALMTTTLPAMKATIEAVRERLPEIPVFVGGAVVTAEWAESVGAGYSADAPGCVEVVRNAIAVRKGDAGAAGTGNAGAGSADAGVGGDA
ncbi:MAG: homocysteine S-methyltransferase family protein, partial [Actinomycetota bacterium]|nr:homocysteine S-methyltransferase family protein [Actinomycetota bacterium]